MKKLAKQLVLLLIVTLSIAACNSNSKQDNPKETAIVNPQKETNQESKQVYKVGSQIPNDLVCMVNNAYMGKPQIPVPVNGKTYYGCCQMCVGKLNNDETARTGIDPFSNKAVDKTEAYIILMKEEGEVAYFESKENYLNYLKKQ
jgi:YHS domain-containing protein